MAPPGEQSDKRQALFAADDDFPIRQLIRVIGHPRSPEMLVCRHSLARLASSIWWLASVVSTTATQ